MLDLKDQVPSGIRFKQNAPRLEWRCGNEAVQTDFDRFRPVGVSRGAKRQEITAFTWQDFGDLPMNDPFFKVSIENAEKLEFTSGLFKTDPSVLSALAAQPDLLPFSGSIFHMARTGSTLIHRLLSCTGKVQSLSEVGVIDRTLQATQNWSPRDRNKMLQDLLGTFRRPRRPGEQHFITKMTDSGASVRLPLFRAAFPQTPWIFAYREPVEVMVSMLTKPTGNIQGWKRNRAMAARRLGMPVLRDPAMGPAKFVALTLRRFCQSAVDTAKSTPNGLFLAVHYKRLPDAIWETIAPHFGIEFTPEEIEIMRAESKYASKKTDATEFQPDSERKQQEATATIKKLAGQYVEPVFEELKRLPQA